MFVKRVVLLNVKANVLHVVSAENIIRMVITLDVLKCVRNANHLGVIVDVPALNVVKLNVMESVGVQSVIR